jgi:hypothetical protein
MASSRLASQGNQGRREKGEGRREKGEGRREITASID